MRKQTLARETSRRQFMYSGPRNGHRLPWQMQGLDSAKLTDLACQGCLFFVCVAPCGKCLLLAVLYSHATHCSELSLWCGDWASSRIDYDSKQLRRFAVQTFPKSEVSQYYKNCYFILVVAHYSVSGVHRVAFSEVKDGSRFELLV